MAIDLTAQFTGLIDRLRTRMVNDMLALPEEKRSVSAGGVAPSPLHMMAECALLNERIASGLRGGVQVPAPSMSDRAALLASFTETEPALTYFQARAEALLDAIRNTDPARWDEPVELLLSRPGVAWPGMKKFDAVVIASGHMAYHDGQLTHIQMLCGDGESHW